MCGYYYSYNIPIDSGVWDSIQRRGPESFNRIDVKNEHFGHALLNTRGKSTPQPIQNNAGTLVYNGSTYNSAGYKHWQVQYMKDHDYPVTLNKTRFSSSD